MQQHYKLRPSRFLSLFCLILCAAVLVSLWLLPLPESVSLMLTCGVLVWSGYCLLSDANLRKGYSCVAFRLEDQEEIVLVLRDGRHVSGRVSHDSLVTPFIIILNVELRTRRGGRSLLILPDTMGEESYRRLRVALRWGDKADQAAI